MHLSCVEGLLIAAAILLPPATNAPADNGGSAVLTASIMSDDYTTYRRARGDASRVGQRNPVTIRIRTA